MSILLEFASIGIIFICENSKAHNRIFISAQVFHFHGLYFFLKLCESWLQIFKNQILGKKKKANPK